MTSPAAGGGTSAEIFRALPPRVISVAAASAAIVIAYAAWTAFHVGGERLAMATG